MLMTEPTRSYGQSKCQRIERDLDQQSELARNLVARERAAIEDLKNPKLDELYKRMLAGWDHEKYREESNNWDQGLRCINAEAELKYYQIAVAEEKQLIAKGCQKGKVTQYKVESVRQREEDKAKECGKVDPAYYAQMVKQLDEVKGYKLANEEKPGATAKKADVSAADTQFCRQVKSISALAPGGFKPIKGAKKPEIMFLDTSVPLQADYFSSSISLSFEGMAAAPDCEVMIGNEKQPDIQMRVRPNYVCTWRYVQTNRKELEERVDKLLNAARGCFSTIEEMKTDDGSTRHLFVGDQSTQLSGYTYCGEGKPSYIRLSISKYAPDELMACVRWKNGSQRNKALCEKAFR
jgi:hypothetical protein